MLAAREELLNTNPCTVLACASLIPDNVKFTEVHFPAWELVLRAK
jgi:hypothetical protein